MSYERELANTKIGFSGIRGKKIFEKGSIIIIGFSGKGIKVDL
jgi:hypothetical protein